MVKGKTKSGIKFQIDERIKTDTRLLMYSVDMQSEDKMVQTKATFEFLELLFGGRKGVQEFQNAVAAAHDGICSTDDLMSEMHEIMEALNVKKS